MMKQAMVYLHSRFRDMPEFDVLIVSSVHDEIICECRHSDVEKVSELIKAVMETSGPVLSVPLTVQLKTGVGTLV